MESKDNAILVDNQEVEAAADPQTINTTPGPVAAASGGATSTPVEVPRSTGIYAGSWGSFQSKFPSKSQQPSNSPALGSEHSTTDRVDLPPSYSESTINSQSRWGNGSRMAAFNLEDRVSPPPTTSTAYRPVISVLTSSQMRQGQSRQPDTPSKTYMIWSAITTLFCCLAIGLAAVYYSNETQIHNKNREYAKARAASGKAMKANIAAMVTCMAIVAVNVILYYAYIVNIKCSPYTGHCYYSP